MLALVSRLGGSRVAAWIASAGILPALPSTGALLAFALVVTSAGSAWCGWELRSLTADRAAATAKAGELAAVRADLASAELTIAERQAQAALDAKSISDQSEQLEVLRYAASNSVPSVVCLPAGDVWLRSKAAKPRARAKPARVSRAGKQRQAAVQRSRTARPSLALGSNVRRC